MLKHLSLESLQTLQDIIHAISAISDVGSFSGHGSTGSRCSASHSQHFTDFLTHKESGSWVGDVKQVKWEHNIMQQQGSNPRHFTQI